MASSSSDIEDSEVRYTPYHITHSTSQQSISQSTSTQSVPEKRLYLPSAVINSAREKLLTFQRVHEVQEGEEEKEGYLGSREITIKENVSLEEFLRYLENNERFPVRLCLHNGNIKAYEVTTSGHSYTAGTIKILMGSWNRQDFDYGDDGDLILGQNVRRPDCMIKPRNCSRLPTAQAADTDGGAYPTMVVEVGYSQGLPKLHEAAALYFHARTTIQIVLIIKIFGVHTDNTIALSAVLYLRTSPTPLIPIRVISFGTANIDTNVVNYITDPNGMGVLPRNFIGVGLTDPNNNNYPPCNMANIPTYLLNIPGPELFDGVPANLLSVGHAAGFNLDLWEIQGVIRRQKNI